MNRDLLYEDMESNKEFIKEAGAGRWEIKELMTELITLGGNRITTQYGHDNSQWLTTTTANDLNKTEICGSGHDLHIALMDLIVSLRTYNYFSQRQNEAARNFDHVEEKEDLEDEQPG